jgi:uncharacterized protein (UPF0332 family)
MTQEAGKLLDKAGRALHAAQALIDSGDIDFAAGRVYYAMFYTAEALLREKNLRFGKHTAVHAAYGQNFAKTGLLDPKFHHWLLSAFDKRIIADYEIEFGPVLDDVREMMEQARDFLRAATLYLAVEE